MKFNGVNYGTVASFSRHSAIPIKIINHINNTMTTGFEKEIMNVLGLPYSQSTIFMNGRQYRNLEEVYNELKETQNGVDLTPYGFKHAFETGRLFDDIINPVNLKRARATRRRRLPQGGTESDILRAINVTEADMEALKRIFNFKTNAQAINFIRQQRMNL